MKIRAGLTGFWILGLGAILYACPGAEACGEGADFCGAPCPATQCSCDGSCYLTDSWGSCELSSGHCGTGPGACDSGSVWMFSADSCGGSACCTGGGGPPPPPPCVGDCSGKVCGEDDGCGTACPGPTCNDGVCCAAEALGQGGYCCGDCSTCANRNNDGTATGCFCSDAQCPSTGRP